MKHLYNSNILEVTSGVIVHGCNAQGVMGSGVAKQLRAKYPEIYGAYVKHLDSFKAKSSKPLGSVSFVAVHSGLIVANAITQEFYGRDGKQYVSYEALHKAMLDVIDLAYGGTVHVPYLIGAGLGGGNEQKVMKIFESLNYENICFHHLNKQ